MKIRTLLLILLAMGAVHGMASLFVANRELLEREFHFGAGYDLKVGLTLLLFLVAGVLFATGAGLTREASKLMDGWKRRKEDRRSERIEEEYSKGLAAVLEGRDDEAMRRFRAALEWDSRHFNTLLKLGEVLRTQERFDEAIELHRKAHHLKEDDPRPLYALVEDYEAKNDLERARAVLGRILALRKDSVSAWRKLRSLHMKERDWPLAAWSAQVPAERMAGFLAKVASRELPGPLAKQVFAWMADEPGDVAALLERHGVKVQASADDLTPLVRATIDEHPGPVAQYLGGKTATLGFLVGQVMKKSGGQAVPQTVKELLEEELARRAPTR